MLEFSLLKLDLERRAERFERRVPPPTTDPSAVTDSPPEENEEVVDPSPEEEHELQLSRVDRTDNALEAVNRVDSQDEGDDECPVCMDTLSSSKTVDCPNGHTFCRDCLRRVYEQDDRVLACPLCRTPIDSTSLKLRSMRAPKGGAIVTLRIGNTCCTDTDSVDASGQRLYRWEVFVDVVGVACRRRGETPRLESLVSAVVFELHPSFDPPRVSVSASRGAIASDGGSTRRFSVEREGWGTFVVRIAVVFCGSYRIGFKHRLSFDAGGSAVKERRVSIGPSVVAAVERAERLSRPLLRPATATTARHEHQPAFPTVAWRASSHSPCAAAALAGAWR